MMKKLLLTITAAVLACAMVMAAPAKPNTITHVQSDGTTVTLTMRGGEFNRSLVTMDGLTVGRDAHGDYCYSAGGALSDMLAHDPGARGLQETAFVVAYRDQMALAGEARRVPRREDENDHPQVPTMGSPRIPIILVNYTDIRFVDEDPVTTFQNQFNEKPMSCLHYFESQSRGLFSPKFDILGPVDLPNDRAFYGSNKRVFGTDVDEQLGTMIYDACTGLNGVDFSDYDNDGDGFVDVVVVLYAGVGEAQAWHSVPECVWPCQWDMQEALDWDCSTTGPFQLDGVTINRFAVFNELEGSNNNSTEIDGVGTFCHEFGHCLGLPDFYPTNGGNYYGMSTWDIMDNGCYLNGGHTPAGYTSYERHFMGWMDLIDATPSTQYTLAPLNTDEGTAVKVTNDANPDEYYLLEYRTKTGWDAYIAGEGIMVLHVDYDKYFWDNNTPNNSPSHPRMTIIPADNILSDYTNRNDLWPYGDHNELTDESTPAATVYAGGLMHKPITEMAISDDKGTASFKYMWNSFLPGDVNHDKEVNVADVNALLNMILSGDTSQDCDVNGDGEVNIADINAVINIILQ
jgi:M6 family metalloprotease-like protein